MIFRRSKKHVKEGMSTMDKLVTGIIIGGAAASIFGISRTKKGRTFLSKIYESSSVLGKKGWYLCGKISIKILDFLDNKK